ncbi:MAG TPA: signal peptidase I [Candidatus Pacebacteria bacterium]|nr:signal peptidase I [Candidatus Paceibacterota bacterium]
MSPSSAIIFDGVSKFFNADKGKQLKNLFNHQFNSADRYVALKDVSFTIKTGECVGLNGSNGAGKSTLFRLIAGIYQPDSGLITVNGQVAPVLELGSGLHPELSGIDNINLYASILGYWQNLDQKIIKKIINFSQLNEFIFNPIRTYSTGMRARLAFSIAIHSNAKIMLFDEALSAGDSDFNFRALREIKKLIGRKTILISSHNFGLLQQICGRMITIENKTIQKTSETNIGLFLTKLPIDHEFFCKATSNSMWPIIKKGDSVGIKKVALEKLKIDDVVMFSFKNISQVIIHRIVEIKTSKHQLQILTKGDFADQIDPWQVEIDNYLGKVIKINNRLFEK